MGERAYWDPGLPPGLPSCSPWSPCQFMFSMKKQKRVFWSLGVPKGDRGGFKEKTERGYFGVQGSPRKASDVANGLIRPLRVLVRFKRDCCTFPDASTRI